MKNNLVKIVLLVILALMFSCSVMNEPDEPDTAIYDETELRSDIANHAKMYVHTRYRYASTNPAKGFDCSGFSSYILNKYGFEMPRSSTNQAHLGKKVSLSEAKVGDLVFFGKRRKISHVAIIVKNENGNMTVVHSTNSKGVIEENIKNSRYWRKRVLFARDVVSTSKEN